MDSTTYSLNSCVDAINKALTLEGLPANMTVRLLRHYSNAGVIPKSGRDGKNATYTELHVEAAVALRRTQAAGITSKAFLNYVQSGHEVDLTSPVEASFDAAYESTIKAEVAKVNDVDTFRRNALQALSGLSASTSAFNIPLASSAGSNTSRGLLDRSLSSRSSMYASPSLITGSASMAKSAEPLSKSLTPVSTQWAEVYCTNDIRIQLRTDNKRAWTEKDTQSVLQALQTLPKDFL